MYHRGTYDAPRSPGTTTLFRLPSVPALARVPFPVLPGSALQAHGRGSAQSTIWGQRPRRWQSLCYYVLSLLLCLLASNLGITPVYSVLSSSELQDVQVRDPESRIREAGGQSALVIKKVSIIPGTDRALGGGGTPQVASRPLPSVDQDIALLDQLLRSELLYPALASSPPLLRSPLVSSPLPLRHLREFPGLCPGRCLSIFGDSCAESPLLCAHPRPSLKAWPASELPGATPQAPFPLCLSIAV